MNVAQLKSDFAAAKIAFGLILEDDRNTPEQSNQIASQVRVYLSQGRIMDRDFGRRLQPDLVFHFCAHGPAQCILAPKLFQHHTEDRT
jgi:hypothetical protein